MWYSHVAIYIYKFNWYAYLLACTLQEYWLRKGSSSSLRFEEGCALIGMPLWCHIPLSLENKSPPQSVVTARVFGALYSAENKKTLSRSTVGLELSNLFRTNISVFICGMHSESSGDVCSRQPLPPLPLLFYLLDLLMIGMYYICTSCVTLPITPRTRILHLSL